MTTPVPTLPWYPWPGQGWPASASQESAFVDELTRIAADPTSQAAPHTVERGAFTAVLNALRGGATFQDMLSVAPKLDARQMLSAYRLISDRLAQATAAWEVVATALYQEADQEDFRRLVEVNLLEFGRVLPHVSERLLPLISTDDSPALRLTMATLSRRVSEAVAHARNLERLLYAELSVPYRHPGSVRIGQMLYNPYGDSAYTNPFYLPDRVASVDAVRARLLLFDIAEDPEEDEE